MRCLSTPRSGAGHSRTSVSARSIGDGLLDDDRQHRKAGRARIARRGRGFATPCRAWCRAQARDKRPAAMLMRPDTDTGPAGAAERTARRPAWRPRRPNRDRRAPHGRRRARAASPRGSRGVPAASCCRAGSGARRRRFPRRSTGPIAPRGPVARLPASAPARCASPHRAARAARASAPCGRAAKGRQR